MATRELWGLVSLFIVSTILIIPIANAQLGEVAGQLVLNVSIGSANSLPFTVVNAGSTPVSFDIILPTLKSTTANTVLPTVSTSVMNGTIPPRSQFTITVNFSVPYGQNNKVGTVWTGILQAVEVSNGSSLTGSGANIHEGVAKLVQITAAPPRPTLLPYIIAGVVAVVAVAGGVIYLKKFHKPGKASGRAPKKADLKRQKELAKLRDAEAALRAKRLALEKGTKPKKISGAKAKPKKAARKAAKKGPAKRRRR